MEMTFDEKTNQLVREFFEYKQTEEFNQPKIWIHHINYDMREAIHGIEADMRTRLRAIQVEKNLVPTWKIPVQDIVTFILHKFFNSEIDLDELMKDYFSMRELRKTVKFQATNSHLTIEQQKLVYDICFRIKRRLIENKISSKEISYRTFIDYLINKFIQEYYI